MTTERVVVRMSRSEPTIPWAFSLRESNGNITVGSVNTNGLAEKAGLQVNDILIDMCGRKLSINDAERLVREPRLDINMTLSRFVTSHPCIPWTLNEKGNQIVVDNIRQQLPLQQDWMKNAKTETSTASSNSVWNSAEAIPVRPTANDYTSRYETNNYAHSNTANNIPISRLGRTSSGAPFASGTSHFSNSTALFSSTNNFPSGNNSLLTTYTTKSNEASLPQQRQNMSSGGSPSRHVQYSSVPLNQTTYIQTTLGDFPGGEGHSPNRVFYHSPQSRSRRELSPNASIRHLQYNSPMNLYSADTVAEQFEMQTGHPIENRIHSKSPAYVNSETRKLIQEREGDFRGPSPSHQSPAFDRISQACGTPVH